MKVRDALATHIGLREGDGAKRLCIQAVARGSLGCQALPRGFMGRGGLPRRYEVGEGGRHASYMMMQGHSKSPLDSAIDTY